MSPPRPLALTLVSGASAASFTLGPLVQVSGASPLTGCTADDAAGQTGTVFPNSEVEPWIDVNPTNPGNMIGIWQQDRWPNSGARGLVAWVTTNGGASWSLAGNLKTTVCTGGTAGNRGNYQRATGPWVTFGPGGVAHQLSLSFNDLEPPFTTFDFDHALLASRSLDGGVTWSDPVVVIRDTAPTVFNDKQTITADQTNRTSCTRPGIGWSFRQASGPASSRLSTRASSAGRSGSPGRRTED